MPLNHFTDTAAVKRQGNQGSRHPWELRWLFSFKAFRLHGVDLLIDDRLAGTVVAHDVVELVAAGRDVVLLSITVEMDGNRPVGVWLPGIAVNVGVPFHQVSVCVVDREGGKELVFWIRKGHREALISRKYFR